jgi:hypothetical protein
MDGRGFEGLLYLASKDVNCRKISHQSGLFSVYKEEVLVSSQGNFLSTHQPSPK